MTFSPKLGRSVHFVRALVRITGLSSSAAYRIYMMFAPLVARKDKEIAPRVVALFRVMCEWNGETFWNYEPAIVKRCIVGCSLDEPGDHEAVEIFTADGATHLIRNDNNEGWWKCLNGGGPDLEHRSVPRGARVVGYR